jgi:hypothetical protein
MVGEHGESMLCSELKGYDDDGKEGAALCSTHHCVLGRTGTARSLSVLKKSPTKFIRKE